MESVPTELLSPILNKGWIPGPFIDKGGGGAVFTAYSRDLVAALVQLPNLVSNTRAREAGEDIQAGVAKLLDSIMLPALERPQELVGALKIVSQERSKRFAREIAATAETEHPALIRLFARDGSSEPRWYVMQYHPRGTLDGSPDEFRGRPVVAANAIQPVAEALGKLHGKGYVHRDIKSKNVFLNRQGGLVLGDFGIVFQNGADLTELTRTGEFIFSRDWIPDWILADPKADWTPKDDVFQLGKILYFLVAGRNVPASQLNEDRYDLTKVYPGADGIDDVWELIRDCVSTSESAVKYQDAGELSRQIASIAGERKSKALVYVMNSTHSTTDVILQTRPDRLLRAQCLLPTRWSRLTGRARVLLPREDSKVSLWLDWRGEKGPDSILDPPHDRRESDENRGYWSDEITFSADEVQKEGWGQVVLWGQASQERATLTAFQLYAE